MTTPDAIDVRILRVLTREPRVTVSELAERVGVARNTAQSRLDRLHALGVLGSNDRGVDLRALGFTVSAVISIEVTHALIHDAVAVLADNPAVLQLEEIAGAAGDLLCRVAARSTDDLQRVVHTVLATPGVTKTATSVVLTERLPYRVSQLLDSLDTSTADRHGGQTAHDPAR